MPGLCACYGAVEIKRIKIKSTKPHRRKEITEWKLSSGPLAIVSEASGVVTVTNWYGIDDNRAAAGAYMPTAAHPYRTETRTGPRGRALGPTITM